MSTSIGVIGVFTSAWYFNKPNFYMIDVTTWEELFQGLLTSFLNFLSELIGLLLFDRVVYKVFRVSLIELGVAFVSTVGHLEFFAICAGCTSYILFFMVYHAGSDYYFKFEWMKEENKNDPSWCDLMQQSRSSCFYQYSVGAPTKCIFRHQITHHILRTSTYLVFSPHSFFW